MTPCDRPRIPFLITIEQLNKVYPRSSQPALRDVSLTVPEGSVFGLLGPNGAGKTTLISILAGILRQDSGRIEIAGLDHARELARIRALTGLVPQDLAFYPTLSVRENLDFYAGVLRLRGRDKAARIDYCLGVTDLERHLDKRAEACSGGLKRRLNLAIGLLNRPRLLILDEPTVGVDPQSRHFILQSLLSLRDQGTTIVYTSHYLEEVQQLCDRLAIIDRGGILVSGPTAEILRSVAGEALTVSFEPALDASGREALSQALATPVSGEGLTLSLDGSAGRLERLIAYARDNRLDIRSLRYGSRDLEEVFLQLTRSGTGD